MKRIKVSFAGLEVEFVDRERALEQVREFGERGTFPVYVIYGPEGSGKTALLKQAKAVLEEEFGYHVIYTNPLAKRIEEIFQYSPTAKELVEKAFSIFSDPLAKAVDLVINVAGWIMQKFRRARVAVLMDDIFQAVGVENAEAYVKALLNLIEWPPAEYDKIVVLVASSEGVTGKGSEGIAKKTRRSTKAGGATRHREGRRGLRATNRQAEVVNLPGTTRAQTQDKRAVRALQRGSGGGQQRRHTEPGPSQRPRKSAQLRQ